LKFEQGKINDSPYLITIYGGAGVGKSSFATFSKNPFFIDVENGTKLLDVKRVSEINSFEEFMHILTLCKDKEEMKKYDTFVIDTIDFLERLIFEKVCADHKKQSISDIGYNKGYDFAVEHWFKVFSLLDQIRTQNKNIILIAHEQIRKFESPIAGNYDRFTLKMHHKIINFIFAKCDAVLFMERNFFVSADGKAYSKKGRKVYTEEQASVLAKNRYGLPPEIILNAESDFSTFFDQLK
jgi:phage nucleotide-binding protein